MLLAQNTQSSKVLQQTLGSFSCDLKDLVFGWYPDTSQVSSYICDDCIWNIFWPGITIFLNQFSKPEKRDVWAFSKDYRVVKRAYTRSYCFKESQVLLDTTQQEPVSELD